MNKDILINSNDIAIMKNIRHSHLREAIKKWIKSFNKNINVNDYFIESVYTNSQNKEQPCYLVTLKGVKYIIDNSRKTNNMKPLIEWYNNNSDNNLEAIVLYSRFEESFMKKLQETLNVIEYDLEIQYPVLSYRLDGYIPQLNIAVEYDEHHHEFIKENDLKREKEIFEKLKCHFVRCNYINSDAYNIGIVIKYIIENKIL